MRSAPSGKVNLIGLVMLLGVGGAIYYGLIFGPLYLDNIDVTDAVAAAFNQVGQVPDNRIVPGIKDKLLRIGTHRELNDNNELVEVPGLGVEEDAITFERNPDNTVLIRVVYEREVRLKPTQRWSKVRFSPTKTGTPMGLK